MKVYLDDERPTPDGWVGVRTVQECIEKLKTGKVEALSLDHDLGTGYAPGYDVLTWMEREVFTGDFVPPKYCFIHTANPTAKDRMMAARFKVYQEAKRKEEAKNASKEQAQGNEQLPGV